MQPEVHLVEGQVEHREHQPCVPSPESLDADTLRRPDMRVVEQATPDAQQGRPGLVAAHALEEVLDPVARVMHHHVHRVMAMKVREHGRGSLGVTAAMAPRRPVSHLLGRRAAADQPT
jgi:hypothetical protein